VRFTVGVATLLLSASSALAQGFQMPTGTAAIAGRVTADDTGQPIRGAIVEIVIFGNLSGRFRSVSTDAEGRYELKDLPPGQYRLAASATRFLQSQYGTAMPGPVGLNNPARTITLVEGEKFPSADFSLLRFCAIEGSIVDEFGQPVPNVMVQVSQLSYGGGRKRLMPAIGSQAAGPIRPTDDNGRFRISGLAPGEYYVTAMAGAFADATAAGGFNLTLYPGTTDPAAARAVTLTPGRDQLNISFALVPAAMTHVTGTLVDGNGQPVKGGNMILMPSERSGATLFAQTRTVAGEQGAFTFRNVPPGRYTIQAYGAQVGTGGNLNAFAFGYLTFTVDGKTNAPLTVRVPAPRALRGHISFEDDTSALPRPNEVRVFPAPADFESAPMGGGPPPSTTNADWTFEVKAMSGLRLVTANAPRGWMVKRVTLGGQDITDLPVDLREHDVNDVEIVMSLRTTTVSGTVTDSDDKALANYNVVVFSPDEAKWGLWSRYVQFSRTDANGRFSVRGLPAGAYIAVALPTLVTGQWQDPEFLTAQRSNATAARFTLLDADTKTVTLKVRK
jgi:protocatechuate 3,4-dioxygenase beta subunit